MQRHSKSSRSTRSFLYAGVAADGSGEDRGIVEHDPEDIWQSQIDCARRVLVESGIDARQVAAVGITNQRETTILWERATGQPVAPAIVWQSRISTPICTRLKASGLESEVRRRTGLLLDPYFSASKIVYLLETIPGLRQRCLSGEILFGTVDSFLIWRLTGGRVHATDPTNACRTLLFDIEQMGWSEALCDIFDVPHCCRKSDLPVVHLEKSIRAGSVWRFQSQAVPAISRQQRLHKAARRPVRQKIRTAPVRFSCSPPAHSPLRVPTAC